MDENHTTPQEAHDEPELTEQQISEQSRIRREKLRRMQDAGQNPFQQKTYDWTHTSEQIVDTFDALEGKTASIAGRLISKRVMGKATFCHVQDGAGRIQIYVRKDELGEEAYAAFKELDIGDILGVAGEVFRTNKGEISVKAQSYTLLSKSLLPLPEKFHGLRDPDARYRQRYVDLIVNPGVKDAFIKRSQAITAIREFLVNEGFIEVDTPVLHTLETGAEARPFETHLNALDMHLYLRIEVELYLKRLIVGGLDRVFEIARIFRNEGMSVKHNPEFTMCEFYQAYTDYYGMMDLIERLFSQVALKVCGTMKIPYQGIELDLTPPWRRITMADCVKEYAGVDYSAWQSDEQARAQLKDMGIECAANATKGQCLAAVFDEKCEHHLVQPTILMDYPVEISPLAKRRDDDPMFTERFEFFIYGREGGNAFTELNDPIDQRERFIAQVKERRAEGSLTAEVDEDFLRAMEYGMPPTGGLGFGVDRFVMLLTDSPSIRDVLLFPTMRPRG